MKSSLIAGISLIALANTTAWAEAPPRPMFAVQPGLRPNIHRPTALPTWNFTFTYNGSHYSDIFVGTNPTGGASTTIPTYIIPIKLTFRKLVEDPTAPVGGGLSPVAQTVASPIFQSGIDFNQGGTDIGNTQYEDAFQRASLWGTVSSQTGYHVLLGQPTIEPVQSLKVPAGSGSTGKPFGTKVIEANINWFDGQIQPMLRKFNIPANSLPIFITTQTYLTSGGCCIGGYHSYTGTQAYSMFTYIHTSGGAVQFSQDVSALSHEVGEWLDDPETNNNSPCGIYEVGDPLEREVNYGSYPYALGGFTYHLQDLAMPPYFGAPTSTSVNGWKTFQGTSLSVCQNGA